MGTYQVLVSQTKYVLRSENMCLGHSEADNQHAQWLLEIGAGSTMDNNKMIQVPL